MHIQVLHETLVKVVQDLQKSIPTRPSLPILSCILISADEENKITFSATDLNIGIIAEVTGQVLTPGKAAVPAKIFTDFISSLEPGKISIEEKEQSLIIANQDASAQIQCLIPEDYPPFPKKDGVLIELPFQELSTAIQNVAFSSSIDEARPILTAVMILSQEGKIEVIATDGFRLATQFISSSTEDLKLLIPAKGLLEVMRIASKKKPEKVAFTVSQKLKQVFFSLDGVEVLVRLMEGDYPPYQKIIPPSFQTQISFDGAEFAQKLKTALIFARESSGTVKLKISQDSLKLISASSSVGNQESTMKAQLISGGDQEIAFNARYLSDFLQVVKPGQIWFGMNESLKPALFRPLENESYRYIVMPFRLNQ